MKFKNVKFTKFPSDSNFKIKQVSVEKKLKKFKKSYNINN